MQLGAAALLVSAVVACSDATNPQVGKGQNVSLSFAGRVPGAAGIQSATNIMADSMVITSGANTLVISSVEIVLREVELKRQTTTLDCDSTAVEDACEEFTLGAMLVNVPLAAGVTTAFTIPIDSGTYTKAEFKIHKPGNDSVDTAFMAANPTWPANISIRVTGRYNGVAFSYTTPLDVDQETSFNPELVIDASGTTTNLTLRVDVATWFKKANGALIDPATANTGGANESAVQNNIKNSFKTFEDHDSDGNESNG
jgi:hypothetical protein